MAYADFHIEAILAEAKARFFERSFDDFAYVFDSFIPTSTVQNVWDKLRAWGPDGFQVESAFTPGVYKDAHLIVSIVHEVSDPEGPVMNNAGNVRLVGSTPSYGVEFSQPVNEVIAIYIMTHHRDVLRLIDMFIKSAIFSAARYLVDNGLSGPFWKSTNQLAPVEAMAGKETVLKLVRKQVWNIFDNPTVRPFGGEEIVPRQILVHATGTFVNSVPNPETRTMTPLSATSQGRVTPADD